MRSSLVCTTLLGFLGFVLAAPQGCSHKLKEAIQPPRGWIQRHPAPPDLTIDLRIALPQSNYAQLEQHLYEISDPFHERYREHLTKEEVEELVAPHPESFDRVAKWLASHGLTESNLSLSPARDWLKVKVPISLAEKMLDTKYHVWENTKNGNTMVRTTAYSLPEDLYDHIELVQPTTLFATFKNLASTFHLVDDSSDIASVDAPPIVVPSAARGQVDNNCNYKITINCLQQLYNTLGYTPSATNGNQIAVTGFLDLFASFADLQQFYGLQRKEALGTNFTIISVNGGQNDQANPGGEANLDTQYAFGLTFPTPGTFYTTAGRPPFDPDSTTPENTNEPYLEWVEFVLSHPNPPQTISTSYADDEQSVPASYAKRVCEAFAQLGARGVSLIFSSGDGGVGDGNQDPTTQECFSNDGKNKTAFIPLFPPSCPFVTSVGGTVNVPEKGVYFSGGGFSNLFPRPKFQDKAIPEYLKTIPKGTYNGLFNPNGRAIPDVAAQAMRYQVVLAGQIVSAAGTSAAAPTFGGVISLLNDVRISQGKSPLGWLNPMLYALGDRWPDALNDILVGNNPGCGTPGFNATKGWDAVTGLGTPNFGKLKEIVTLLP